MDRQLERRRREERSSLEHGIPVETQLILDHAVSDFLGHLALGHFIAGEVGGGMFGAIDAGGEAVFVIGELQMHLFDGFDEGVVDLIVVGDGGEVNHDDDFDFLAWTLATGACWTCETLRCCHEMRRAKRLRLDAFICRDWEVVGLLSGVLSARETCVKVLAPGERVGVDSRRKRAEGRPHPTSPSPDGQWGS